MVDSTLLVAGGVLLIIVAVLVTSNRFAARQTMPRGDEANDASSGTELLLKFVHHEGAVVGETVAVDGESVILKQAGQFKAVPRSGLQPASDGLLLVGAIDWEVALRQGLEWHERNTKGLDPEVTSQLTRSEDVVAPALAAFKDRDSSEE